MKKFLVLMLTLTLIFCVCGCGENGSIEENQYTENEISTMNNQNSESALSENMEATASECVECGRECEDGHSYCDFCECWESDCIMPKKSSSSFCVNHSCLLCTSGRSSDYSPYCSSHKCRKCENVVVEGSSYCVAHKCQTCNSPADPGSQYCGLHK